MNDLPEDDAAESPIRRALRLKQAALDARPKPPRGGVLFALELAAALGKSKPWLKR